MKKLIVMAFIGATMVVSCGKKIIPESGTNDPSKPVYQKDGKDGTQTAVANNSRTTTPSFNDMKGNNNDLPEGPRNISTEKGKTIYVTKCGGCHSLKNPGDFTTDQMNNILKVEIPKANLNKSEADQVTAYLLSNTKK
jgi:mono/diheme cytochrome c family protein